MRLLALFAFAVAVVSAQRNQMCQQPRTQGSCDASNQITKFFYTGSGCTSAPVCSDTDGGYGTEDECIQACTVQGGHHNEGAGEEGCSGDPPRGDCGGQVEERYYFDSTTRTCQTFEYRGCSSGNPDNSYETEIECEIACPSASS
uniref:Monobin n=1 Tax=Argas monolakensis TaxID=34602 RepID=KUNI_ARGMO|nr:RecName: Full=Monobin; AltName: Full=Thrombin inhibitor; Flags: Precursor [Argas monolakensis]ABI52647.1 monobin [Argas monolakensis]